MAKHIQRSGKDTSANLVAAGNYQTDHLYFDETNESYRLAIQANQLSAPFMTGATLTGNSGSMSLSQKGSYQISGQGMLDVAASGSGLSISMRTAGFSAGKVIGYNGTNFVATSRLSEADFGNTDGVSLSYSDDLLTATVNVSSDAGNRAEVRADGIYAKGYSIAAMSANFLEIDQSTGEITFLERAQIKTFAASEATLGDYITNNYTGSEIQEGDILFVPQAGEAYVHNGGTAADATDFTKIQSPGLTNAEIRSKLSAADGIAYNQSTGVIGVDLATADNDLAFVSGKLKLDVSAAAVTAPTSFTATSVQGLFDEIATDLNRKTSNDEDETVYANWSFMQDLALDGATTVTGTLDLEVGSAVNISGEANMFTDLRFDIAGNGIILRSPNNTEFKVTVGNDGALITTALGN